MYVIFDCRWLTAQDACDVLLDSGVSMEFAPAILSAFADSGDTGNIAALRYVYWGSQC